MNTALLVGLFACCFVPLLAFACGVMYARHGVPLRMEWRWRGDLADESDE